jgi:lysophospholipase L1-like esterase
VLYSAKINCQMTGPIPIKMMMTPMNIALPILAVALIGAAFIGGYRFAQWRAIPEYPLYRGAAIRQQSAVIPTGAVLFIGDSIVDQAYVPTVCGVPVLNAGMSGATVADLIPLALDVIKQSKPSRMLISVGINNALPKTKRVTVSDYSQQLDQIVSAALAAGMDVSVLTQTPVRSDQPLGLDIPMLKEIDGAIRRLAQRHQIRLIDVAATLAGTGGEMPRTSTIDGVHLTAEGYAIWTSKIQQEACRPAAPSASQ